MMTELAKLHDRLTKIVSDAETVTRYGRVLEIAPSQTGLDVFAQEIEETRFERRLLFRNERHEELGLHVIAGRILRLTICDLREKLPEQLDLIGQDAAPENTAAMGNISAAIRTFCNEVKILYIKAEPPPESLKHQSIGVNLDAILESVTTPQNQITPVLGPVRLGAFVEHASARADALLHIVAQDVASSAGDEDALETLLDLAESELQFRAREAAQGRVPDADEHCIILASGPTDQGAAMLCATQGEDLVFVKFPVRDMVDFFKLWRDCKLPQTKPE